MYIIDMPLSNKYQIIVENGLINNLDKKSFNEVDLFEWCNPIEIDKKKLKVNWKYNVQQFLKETRL